WHDGWHDGRRTTTASRSQQSALRLCVRRGGQAALLWSNRLTQVRQNAAQRPPGDQDYPGEATYCRATVQRAEEEEYEGRFCRRTVEPCRVGADSRLARAIHPDHDRADPAGPQERFTEASGGHRGLQEGGCGHQPPHHKARQWIE